MLLACIESYCNSEIYYYFFQVITIDPSKHCHAVKLLGDKADDCEKHVEELTWHLDDDECRQSLTTKLPILNGNRSKDAKCKLPPSTSSRLGSDLHILTKTEKPKKRSSLKPKSHISNNSHSQEEVESSHFSASSKRQKVNSSPPKTVKVKKQKITGNNGASLGMSSVAKLQSDNNVEPAETKVKFDGYDKPDSVKSEVQQTRDRSYRGKEEMGVVSFTDEAEMNESFPARQKRSLSHPQQESMYLSLIHI